MADAKYVVIEGLDGSGSTTQTIRLFENLYGNSKDAVFMTREPTMLSPQGREIRRRLKREFLPGEEEIHDPQYWADLFVGDRKYHQKEFVLPNLEAGVHVLSDRHMMSTIAYQTATGGDMENLIAMHNCLVPLDRTFFLQVDIEEAIIRMGTRGEDQEYFEAADKLRKVAEAYDRTIDRLKDQQNIIVIDGHQSIKDVAEEIYQETKELLRGKAA